jgi:hypothetical protein
VANLREAWAASAVAGLGWAEDVEKAIDRVAAGGFCKPLQLRLFKLRYMNEASSYDYALKALERVLARRYRSEDADVRSLIAKQVLREYLVEFCTVCLGVGERVEKKLRVVCPSCDGSGVRRYGDAERAGAMQMSQQRVRSLHAKLEWLMDFVQRQDRIANAILVAQLRA